MISPSDLPALLQALETVARDLNTILNPALWLQTALDNCRDTLIAIFRDLLLSTGDAESASRHFIDSRTVAHFEPIAQVVANLGLVATVGYGCFRMMLSHSAQNYYTVRILLPRLLLGVVLINFALPLFQGAIDVNNALCATVLKAGLSLDWRHLFSNFDFLGGPGLIVLVFAALFLGYVLLAFVYVIRYALLVV